MSLIVLVVVTDGFADGAEPADVTTLANVIVFIMECIRITSVANPIMLATGCLLRSALRATEIKASSAGTFFICGVQSVIVATEPLVVTDITAVFDRVGYIAIGTNPSVTGCTEKHPILLTCTREIVNLGAITTPIRVIPVAVAMPTCFVPTVSLTTTRTFPTAVRALRSRIINAIATFFAAPTIPVRTGVGLQMPHFATGMLFVDVTVPGVVAGCSFRRIIGTPTVFVFAEPITVRTRCRK